MAKNSLSLKQSNKSKKSAGIEPERMPNYLIKPPKFSCPVSPDILWERDLVYTSCPLAPDQRDMGTCANCRLKGESKARVKSKRDSVQQKVVKQKSEKKKKEQIPVIGKTYVSK